MSQSNLQKGKENIINIMCCWSYYLYSEKIRKIKTRRERKIEYYIGFPPSLLSSLTTNAMRVVLFLWWKNIWVRTHTLLYGKIFISFECKNFIIFIANKMHLIHKNLMSNGWNCFEYTSYEHEISLFRFLTFSTWA